MNSPLLKYIFFVAFFFFWGKHSFAQATGNASSKSDPFKNPVILTHYSVADLQLMQAQDSVKFQTVVYYYTRSYIIEKISCTDCIEINISTFDVSEYEKFRKKSERYIRVFDKYGFKLTLLSIDELQYKLPIHN